MRYLNLIVISLIYILVSCQATYRTVEKAPAKTWPENLPENLWVSESLIQNLDSTLAYYKVAREKLQMGDTLGAEIFFDQAFEVLTNLSDEDKNTLQNWPEYDAVFKSMNDTYKKIYLTSHQALEAEEIREDISAFEELNIPDSVLFGEGTVVDSSGPMPITLNKKVRLAIKYFQTKGRFVFTKWLERSGRYEKIVKDILQKKGLPTDLFYLAMIESGFNPSARSYARAVGMWQFISATGRHYGLRHNWWFDERRDYVKATEAAADHLADLYDRFGDWYLALAGYNCNPKKVEYNMRRYHTRNFWKLRRLPRQTRNYIPTFLAATIIAKDPKKFGFYVEKQKPLEVDQVAISESVDLNVIAGIVDTSYAYIREINPAVIRWVTPPGIKDFKLYIPKGKLEKFKQGYARIPDDKKRSWVRHRIRSGETLSTIARKYHTSVSVIKSINKIRGSMIRTGHHLLIPVPQNKSQYYAQIARNSRPAPRSRAHRKRSTIRNVPGAKKIDYTVKRGDTLGEIAELYATRASNIRAWNGLRYGEHIYPNQKLTIWVPEKMEELKKRISKAVQQKQPGTYYTVRTGDTLWDIAKKYGLSINDLKRMNNMRGSRIRPGDRLKVSKN